MKSHKDDFCEKCIEYFAGNKSHIHKHRGIDSKCQYCEQEKKEIES